MDDFNHDTYDLANDTYMIPFIMLTSFLSVLKPGGHAPLYKEGIFGVYDSSRDLATMSNRDKFWQDKIVMLEFFTELMTVESHVGDFPVQDEFMRGIRELDQTREISVHLTFAAQMILDIHHILREKVSGAHDNYFSQMDMMRRTLRLHLEFHENLKINHWPKSNDQILRLLQGKIEACVIFPMQA